MTMINNTLDIVQDSQWDLKNDSLRQKLKKRTVKFQKRARELAAANVQLMRALVDMKGNLPVEVMIRFYEYRDEATKQAMEIKTYLKLMALV